MKSKLVLLVSLLLPATVAAETALPFDPAPRRASWIRSDDGLSHQRVYDLAFDSDGLLWIATENGLDRYDGHRIEHFRPGISSLSDDDLATIAIDGRNLWIGAWGGGLSLLDTSAPEQQHPEAVPVGLVDTRVQDILVSSDGTLWVGTYSGVYRRKPGTRALEQVQAIGALRCWSLSEAEGGAVVIAADDAAFRVDPEGGIETIEIGIEAEIREIIADGEVYWVGTDLGLWRVDDKGTTIIADDITVNRLVVSASGELWVGTLRSGLKRLPPGATELEGPDFEPLLDSVDVRDLLIDERQVLWVGTRGHGVAAIPLGELPASSARVGVNGLIDANVVALSEGPDGRLWVGTEKGLSVFENGRVQSIDNEIGVPPLSQISARAIAVDGDKVWIGTYGGLELRTHELELTQVWNFGDEDWDEDHIEALLPRSDGSLVVGTRTGLHLLGTDGSPRLLSACRSCLVWDLVGLPDGRVAIATDTRGLHILDAELGASPSIDLESRRVNDLFLGPSGLWVATDNGTYLLDSESLEILRRIGAAIGASKGTTLAVLETAGALWLATDDGLVRFDLDDGEQLRLADLEDGLPGTALSRGGLLLGSNELIYVASLTGVAALKTAPIEENKRPARRPLLLGASIDGHLAAADQGLVVAPGGRSVELVLSGRSMPRQRTAKLEWRVKDIDSGWLEVGEDERLRLSYLPPGEYLIQVRSVSTHGEVSDSLEVPVKFLAPWWRLPIVRWGALALLLGGIFLTYRSRMKRAEAIEKQLRKLVDERTAELAHTVEELEHANLAKSQLLGLAVHDLRSPLNGMIGFTDLLVRDLDNDRFEVKRAKRFLDRVQTASERMRAIIDELLDVSSIESGKISLTLRVNQVDKLVEEVVVLHEQHAVSKEIKLAVVSPEVPLELVADCERLKEILDNLLSNAIKFTESGGEVELSWQLDDGFCRFMVRDSGQGFEANEIAKAFTGGKGSARPTGGEPSTGFGLLIVDKLTGLHQGHTGLESIHGEGAAFTVHLPIDGPIIDEKD